MNGSAILRGVYGVLQRPFVRDVGILQLGALCAAGIGFVASVVLARTLGADEYGTYALVVSLGTTIGLLRRLGQDQAATTRLSTALASDDPEGARRALSYFTAIGVWTAVAVIPLAILLAPWVTQALYADADLGQLLRVYLVPVVWVVVPATAGLALQCTRQIKVLAWLENGSNALLAVAAIAAAIISAHAGAVLIGQLIASIAIAASGAYAYSWLRARSSILPTAGALAQGIVTPDFPIWADTRSGLAMAVDKNLATIYPLVPVLFLGAVATTESVAQLRIALSYVAIPALLLAPISRMLMVKLPEVQARTPERLRDFFRMVSLSGGLSSAGLTLPFVLAAPWLIPSLYGGNYASSVPLVFILAVDSALLGFGLTAGPLFRTLNRTDLPIRVHVTVLLLGLPATYLVIQHEGAAAAAASYVGLMLAARIVTNALCWRLLTR
ncbi:MAG: lipopolysaccharide biosynthesis protein [Chloroflexota bacterium]